MSGVKISDEQVNQMLKLEQLFHNRYLTPQFLHQLISIYVKAIQSFEKDFRFMRNYFMDKMQFVLSSPQIIALLQKGGSNNQQIRQTIRITQRVFPIDLSSSMQNSQRIQEKKIEKLQIKQKQKQEDRFAHYKQQHHHHKQQHRNYHYDESKNNNTALKIDMKMRIMREVQENTKNIKKQIKQANQKLQKNQQKVKDIAKNQQELLNERLEKRRKKLRKKSVQIKPKVFQHEQKDQVIIEPVIKKQQLKQAQRQLTEALFKFTIRMSKKQSLKDVQLKAKSSIKGRINRNRHINQDQILMENEDEDEEKEENVRHQNKSNSKQAQSQAKTQGRIKTIRRHLQSSDQDQ